MTRWAAGQSFLTNSKPFGVTIYILSNFFLDFDFLNEYLHPQLVNDSPLGVLPVMNINVLQIGHGNWEILFDIL